MGEISTNDVTSKKLISSTYKHLIQLNIKKKKLKNPIEKWAEELNRHFNKEDMQRPTSTWKRCSASSPSGKCKSKPRLSPQTCQNGHHQKEHNWSVLEKVRRKGKPTALSVRMHLGVATMENNMKVPQKIENRTIIGPSNPTSGYLI